MSTTQAELTGALKRCAVAAHACGIETYGWHLQGGSKVNGVQYALVTHRSAIKLGFTKTDAWHALRAMAEAFEMVPDANH